jgi:hypothetical protein
MCLSLNLTVCLAPPKVCACGASYTDDEFDALPYVGRMDEEEDGDQRLVLRNCTCHSTLAMVRPLETT